MKAAPYIIILIVLSMLSANIFLLIEPAYRKAYFLWIDLGTGIGLIAILFLSIFCKKELKRLQQKYIDKYFSKN